MCSKEGEGVICYPDGCPVHGTEFLYRKFVDGFWREFCSEQNCDYNNIVCKERKQNQPIQFKGRRKDDI
jgi:hypothetical protein